MKFFCTEGPVNPKDHYCVPLTRRLTEPELYNLIDQKKYFILHAPRQTGKTSAIMNFVKQLNEEEKYTALYINTEGAHIAVNEVARSTTSLLREIKAGILQQLTDTEPVIKAIDNCLDQLAKNPLVADTILKEFFTTWAGQSIKPIVLFFDEVDALVGDSLISLLKQLRAGYPTRPQHFPQSICLMGVRNLRDYHVHTKKHEEMGVLFSPFNIVAENILVKNFSPEDVRDLYLQHTQETGQQFTDEAITYAFEQTQGQPWLVNALARQACFRDVTDRSKPITREVIENAKESLILRQDTHIDALIDRLHEPRIRNILDSILTSGEHLPIYHEKDIKYAVDLGLIKVTASDITIANPIYQEIIPRALATEFQRALSGRPVDYVLPNGLLDVHKLLERFTEFYRENSAIWLEKFDYEEAGPHLILLAFLQRVINGGGRIHREYALGTDRVDLRIDWFKKRENPQRIVIELKIWRGPKSLQNGLAQTAGYMDTAAATEGHLVIFDPSETKSWEEKVYQRTEICGGKPIHVWGM